MSMRELLDHELIGQRYFFPRPVMPADPMWVESKGLQLCCYHAAGGYDLTVLYFHGNGEVVGDYVPGFEQLFFKMGADLFIGEYRGYGGSEGRPMLGSMLDDVEPMLDAIGRPESEVVVFGRSVGSMYAIELAARRPNIAGLILESGIADPKERVLLRVTPDELAVSADELESACDAFLDHQEKLRRFDKPLLVLHAEADHLIDMSHAKRNFEWAASADKRLVRFSRGDHNSIFSVNQERYVAEVAAFLDRCRQ